MRAYFSDLRKVWRLRERTVAEPPDLAVTAEVTDQRAAFLSALRRLPPRQRAVLVCRYYLAARRCRLPLDRRPVLDPVSGHASPVTVVHNLVRGRDR
jgi:hypothetical protein